MSFADFIASPVRDEFILVELQPRYVLGAFSATGGPYANTYQISMPSVEEGGVGFPMYRRTVGVIQNATYLTERASVALVDANAGSWYWDEGAGVLYVHSTTGSSPNTFLAYQALVEFYVGTKPVTLDRVDDDPETGIYYHPWLSGSLPQLTERDNDQVFGTKVTSGGDITVINAHGWWNRVVAHDGDYRWKNAHVHMLIGGAYGNVTLPRSQYENVLSFFVEDLSASEYEVTLLIYPFVKHLDGTIPRTPYFSSDYPNLGEGVEGTKKWVGYGRTMMPPDLTDDSGYGVYTIADAAYQTLFAVNAAYAVRKDTGVRTLLTLTTDYTVDLTACTLTVVNASYSWEDYTIEVDVTGKPDGAGGYLKTFPEIVEDLLVTYLGFTTDDLDTASFADYDDDSEMAVWVKSPRTISSIMSTSETGLPSMESPIGGMLTQTQDGKWRVENWDPSYDLSALQSFTKSDFTVFRPDPNLSSIFSAVNVYYNYNAATGAWAVETATNAQQGYLQDVDDTLDVYTFLTAAADAQRIAQRMIVAFSGKTLNVEIEETGVRLSTFSVRDKLLVDYDPAPVAAGAFESYPMEVVEVRRSFDPALKVTARLGNLRGIGQQVGRWTDSSAPDYTSATPADRATSGYWSDADGEIVPGDPTTLDRSVWW